ncbi:MAG: ABC transporter substrate-binding protein [Chloroflexi bacterium]|nr:ABC transporter substrate-binding protein [Chloroflexota bacterium]
MKKKGLDVTILEGAVEIVPQQVVASGAAEFGIAWVPKVLESREAGADLVNVAQIFQRSGTLEVSFVDAGITSIADMAGKRVGTWGFGNEHELFAALRAQRRRHGPCCRIIFTTESFLAEEGNEDIAIKFIRASIKGWIFCRDNFDECVDIVLDNGPTLGEGHMRWQLNEINRLIWPSPDGIGMLDEDLWAQTVAVAIDGSVISEEPSEGAFRTDLVEAALESLAMDDMVDVTGEEWEPMDVEITPGGE